MSAGWTRVDPGGGDVDALSGYASHLDELAAQVLRAREQTQAAVQPVAAAWSGDAAQAWWSRANETVTDLAGVATQLDARATALHQYVASVRDIAQRAWSWRQQLVDGGAVVCSAPGGVAGAAGVLDDRAADARARVQLAALAAERSTADAVAVAALGGVQAGEWSVVGAALLASGVVAPAQLDAARIARALAAQAGEMLDGGLTDEDVSALSELLTQWGQDEAAMSAFFTTLGGERTVGLLDALGRGIRELDLDPDAALAVAVLVQQSLSVGSRSWDRQTAVRFAAGLVRHPGAGAAVQFLFTGAPSSPMGEQLTVAVLDLVDQAERLDLAMPWRASDMSAITTLTALRDGALPAQAGIAEIVLDHLARYPDAALDWVLGGQEGATGGTRIGYWFGERVWADGFEAVAGLWAAMQQVPGGPASGAEGYDAARWDALIGANGQIIKALNDNQWFTIEGVSPGAKLRLVDAVAAQLPELVEKSMYGVSGQVGVSVPVDAEVPGLGTRLVPALSPDTLAEVLGVVLSDGPALDRFAVAVAAFQNAMLQPGSGYGVPGAIGRAATLQGVVDGATGGADLSLAAARDARAGSIIAVAEQGAGLAASVIPNPFVGAVSGPVISAVGAGAGWLWSGRYEQVAAVVDAKNVTQEDALRAVVEGLVNEHVTDEMVVANDALYNAADRSAIVDQAVARYHGTAGTAEKAAS